MTELTGRLSSWSICGYRMGRGSLLASMSENNRDRIIINIKNSSVSTLMFIARKPSFFFIIYFNNYARENSALYKTHTKLGELLGEPREP